MTDQEALISSLASKAAADAASAVASTMATSNAGIMKELSDIKMNLAVNTAETQNIKSTISEMKVDIHEIKSLYVTHSEYDTFSKITTKTLGEQSKLITRLNNLVSYAIGGVIVVNILLGLYVAYVKK